MTIQNNSKLLNRSFRVVVSYSEEDKVYYATIPSLESCTSYGDTVEEAIANIREAAEGVIEVMQEQGWPIPDDSQTIEYTLQIPLVPQTA